jgi:hypothetical protein
MKNKSVRKNDYQPKQNREMYFAELRQSLEDTKNGNLISFTVEEFDAFVKTLKMKKTPSRDRTLEI